MLAAARCQQRCSSTLSQRSYPRGVCRAGNLGALYGLTAQDPGETTAETTAWQTARQDYVPSPAHADGPAIFGSTVLLLVLLASGFGRVFGFNAWVDSLVEKYWADKEEKKRNAVYDARADLENKWQGDDKDSSK